MPKICQIEPKAGQSQRRTEFILKSKAKLKTSCRRTEAEASRHKSGVMVWLACWLFTMEAHDRFPAQKIFLRVGKAIFNQKTLRPLKNGMFSKLLSEGAKYRT